MKGSRTRRSENKVVVAGCRGSGCCPTIRITSRGIEVQEGTTLIRVPKKTVKQLVLAVLASWF